MVEHVREWLGAYLDGELHGWRLQQVEKHMEECQECSAELAELRSLSILLRETSTEGDFIPVDRFTAHVLQRLPLQQEPALRSKVMKAGWWLAPVTLLGGWVFAQTVVIVSWMVWAGGQMGLLGAASTWLKDLPQYNLWLHATLSLLDGNLANVQPTLSLVASWGQAFLGQAILLLILAALYWTWLAFWWLRRQRISPQQEIAITRLK